MRTGLSVIADIERRPRGASRAGARSLYVVTDLAGEVILVRLKKHFRGGRSLLKAGFAPDLVRREAPRLIAHHEEYREADKSDFALQGCSGMKFEVGEPEAIVT